MSSQFPPNARKSIAQTLKESMEKRAAEAQQNAQQNAQQSAPLQTVKPNEQDIEPTKIVWKWSVDRETWVYASYYTQDDPDDHHAAGSYIVQLYITADGDDDIVWLDMSVDTTKTLGIVLLSAVEWEHTWQQHMGEFFAAKPPEPNVSRPPEIHVVDDKAVEDV